MDDYFITEVTPELQEKLHNKVFKLKIKALESVDYYIDRHLKLRHAVIQAKYSLIEIEATSVNFFINRLGERPAIIQYVSKFMLQRDSTVL